MASYIILNDQNAYTDLRQPAIIVSGCFVCVALVLSTLLIFQHLRSYTNPEEQKWIVAVLFMVPVYAIESILSLVNPTLSLACDILRNCYEAFALYSFGSGERKVIDLLEDESRKLLSKPLLEGTDKQPDLPKRTLWNFFRRPCVLGKDLLTIEKFGLVQYMILKTVCAFLALVLELFGVYGDGEFKWYYGCPLSPPLEETLFDAGAIEPASRDFEEFFIEGTLTAKCRSGNEWAIRRVPCRGPVQCSWVEACYSLLNSEWIHTRVHIKFSGLGSYPYLAVVLNFSQMWALYCLVQFYNVTHERLKHIKPLAKFISFKAIVFATWWQGVGIVLLCALGVLPKAGKFQLGCRIF
ncbi:hypothetical protein RJ639_024822 [Escallonia herrerae]|uniref:Uncharacterized protein n=1 Tax=Escallonia herrerae TaxID=1293975 RepID=A0AA88RVQ9_9ASTE|nr:hypothetical protein RJ639_024822 [Escallonia herrerae]